jgi:hypothetical protein
MTSELVWETLPEDVYREVFGGFPLSFLHPTSSTLWHKKNTPKQFSTLPRLPQTCLTVTFIYSLVF